MKVHDTAHAGFPSNFPHRGCRVFFQKAAGWVFSQITGQSRHTVHTASSLACWHRGAVYVRGAAAREGLGFRARRPPLCALRHRKSYPDRAGAGAVRGRGPGVSWGDRGREPVATARCRLRRVCGVYPPAMTVLVVLELPGNGHGAWFG